MNRQSAGKAELIINKFNEGFKAIEIAKELHFSYASVKSVLKKSGLMKDRKSPVYTRSINVDYFKDINTEDKAYFLGLIKADGYIDSARNRMSLRLQERDKELLIRLCDALNISIKKLNFIRRKNETSQDHYELSVQNENFVGHLKNVKDSSVLDKVPEHLSRHFIRGYFDGDGCISYSSVSKVKFQINIMGSPNDAHMLEYICRFFNFNIYVDKRSNLPLIQSANVATIMNFRDVCFDNCYIYLHRKKLKFDLFKFIKSTSTTTRETSAKDEDIV